MILSHITCDSAHIIVSENVFLGFYAAEEIDLTDDDYYFDDLDVYLFLIKPRSSRWILKVEFTF